MKQVSIFIVEPRIDILNIYALNLLVYTNAQIRVFANFDELLKALDDESPDGIYVNIDKDAEKSEPDFHLNKKIKLKNIDPYIAVLGLKQSQYPKISCYNRDVQVKELISNFAKKVGITAKEMSELKTEECFPLPQKYFLPGWQCVHPLHIKKDNEYVKVLEAGQFVTQELLNQYKEKEKFYVRSQFRLELVNSFTSRMVALLNDENQTVRERLDNASLSYDMVGETMRSIGLTETTIKVAKAAINSMEQAIKNIPSLLTLLENLKKDQKSARFQHSAIASFVGAQLIQKMDSTSSSHLSIWTATCFFHDMFLDKDEFIWLDDDSQVLKMEITEKEKSLILNHARLAAKILSQHKELPLGIETIVKQHHGSKMGDSLDTISVGISPLAILFILVEEWVKQFLDFQSKGADKFPYNQFIEYLNKKYPYPNFKKYTTLFKEVSFGV